MVPTPVVEGLDELAAVWVHRGDAAAAVRRLKYERGTGAVTALADAMAAVAPSADLVTWVPSISRHRRRRGFDPSELLARAVARRVGLAARRVLRRRDGSPQTDRDRAGRLAGPDLTVVERCQGRLPARILVVDDVCTTGSTLRTAAVALRRSGAGSVVAVVATAASPGRRHGPGVRLVR